MNMLLKLIVSVGLLSFAAHPVSADTTDQTEAKVLKVIGAAQVRLTPDSAPIDLTEGMSLSSGATIMTGADSVVELRTLAGGQTAVQENTTATLDELSVDRDNLGVITKQTATLSLRSGNLISTLDPKRKAINNYKVRTPKGVAAARGTVYAVSVTQTGTSVATLSGTVTLTPDDGGAPIIVDIGTGMIVGSDGTPTATSLASLVQSEASSTPAGQEGAITKAIRQAVASVSAAAANPEINTATTAATGEAASTSQTTSMLAAVIKVAAQANPTQAASYTETAIAAVVSSGNGTAVAAIAEAAAQGAVQGTLESNATSADGGSAAAKAVVQAIAKSAETASASSGGAVGATSIQQAIANGAATGTTNANTSTGNTVTAPTVTVVAEPDSSPDTDDANTDEDTNTEEVESDDTTTPITEIDPTIVSPSS